MPLAAKRMPLKIKTLRLFSANRNSMNRTAGRGFRGE